MLRAVPAERGHRRDRLRAARPRARDGRRGAACGSCSRRRAGRARRARSRSRAPARRPAATAATATSPPRTSTADGVPDEFARPRLRPADGGRAARLAAGRAGRGARGRARRARALRAADRPRRGRAPAWSLALTLERVHVESTRSPAARVRALARDVPAARARRRLRALADRLDRRGRPADRLRARLRALARLPAGPTVPGEGLPRVHRVREPAGRRRDDRRSRSRWRSARGARAACRAGRGGSPSRRLRRHARAGAARRDHRLRAPAPGARHPAPAALDRVLGAAVVVGLEAVALGRGSAAARPRARGSRASVSCRVLCAGRHRHHRHRGRPALRREERLPALVAAPGAAPARRRGGGARLQPDVPARLPVRAAAQLRPLLRRALRGWPALLLVQMALGDIQYRTHLPWWLVLVHVARRRDGLVVDGRAVAPMWRPPARFAPEAFRVDWPDGESCTSRAGRRSSGRSSIAASAAGTTAGRARRSRRGYLAKLWDAARFAEIDPEGFFDFQATRPHVKLEEGLTRRIDWPETVFYHARPTGWIATPCSCSASSRTSAGARSRA